MDLSKFKVADWVMVGAGVAMLIFGLVLDWASYAGASGNNAFDYFFTGGIAWILVVAVGVMAALLAGGVVKPGTAPWPLILLGAAALATLLMLLRIILGGGEVQGIDLDRGAGMWVAFLFAVISLVGAFLNFQSAGGELSHLTDMDKLRSSFKGSGAEASGAVPPPPPPPAAGPMDPPPPPPPAP